MFLFHSTKKVYLTIFFSSNQKLQFSIQRFNNFFFISLGLQYAYLNGEENSGSKKNGENENDLAKGARSEITLDELDDLYRSEEAEKEAELASKR